ncbi:MAG: FAD-dependent oxidoreductase [Chloroflexi bacterium]|nr:FAD-dependent oxidoreductase [Chloroflexota bacterium]
MDVARRLSAADVRRLAVEAAARCSANGGLADAQLAQELSALETEAEFGPGAAGLFQQLLGRLGVASRRELRLPLDAQPFWLRGHQPLANYQSHPELPTTADVVIIGAGLTGASAAYHLAEVGASGQLHVVVLDQGDPAGEASGRNGGNFELIPENCVGLYEGLARERLRFLRRCYPHVPQPVLQAESERQASAVIGLALRNRDRMKSIIKHEGIACDFSPRGWLYLAHTEREEQGLCEEVSLAAQHGQRIELWSRRRIRRELGFSTPYLGRFIPGDGTYHPFKYVCGLLHCALRAGVELHTRRRVCALVHDVQDHVTVVTEYGAITSRRVILATNAFTSQLIPDLLAIRPFQSQVMVTEHAPDRARGRAITSDFGPVFLNQPRAGSAHGRAPLVLGGGADRPMRNPASRRRSSRVHARLVQLRDAFYPELKGQPPTAEWIGPMGFTPDQLPAIGFLTPRVIVAAGFNGYGGSYTTAAGQAAARMAVEGVAPEWVPEDVFSPRRFVSHEPLFMRDHDSLWRIAASLCTQLRNVEAQAAESVGDSNGPARARRLLLRTPQVEVRPTAPCPELDAKRLHQFSLFKPFSAEELLELVKLTRRWEAPRGAVLVPEGSPGGSCFIIVSGSVDVSAARSDRQQWLTTMLPGSIFGQVSLIDREPRSASCAMREPGVVLEMEQEPCAALFASRSAMALKFLAALNHGLITALRGADRRLLRLAPPSEALPEVGSFAEGETIPV